MANRVVWLSKATRLHLKVPEDIKPAAHALIKLLDSRDEELLDFLERRFIDLPPDRT